MSSALSRSAIRHTNQDTVENLLPRLRALRLIRMERLEAIKFRKSLKMQYECRIGTMRDRYAL